MIKHIVPILALCSFTLGACDPVAPVDFRDDPLPQCGFGMSVDKVAGPSGAPVMPCTEAEVEQLELDLIDALGPDTSLEIRDTPWRQEWDIIYFCEAQQPDLIDAILNEWWAEVLG